MSRWRRRLAPALTLGVSLWVLWWSVVNGRAEQRANPSIKLGAAPLVGRDDLDGWVWRFGISLIAAALLVLLVAFSCWRGWWWRARQRWVLVATMCGAMLFAALLALGDGISGLKYGAEHETEYLINLRHAPPAGEFVRTFLDRLDFYSVHVRGHPPGYLLVLKFLRAVGLGGVWPVVVVSLLATGVVAAAVLITVRAVAGSEWMRRAAPLLIVAPYAIWMMTSADALFTCVGALGIAAVAVGATRNRVQALLFGIAAGLLLGFLLYLTYLGAVLLVIPGALLVLALFQRERGTWFVVMGGTAAAIVVVGLFWLAGFWWFDGYLATEEQYHAGSAKFREWSYFSIGNLGAALFAVGPATIAGLGALRNRRLWLLVGAAAVAVTASHMTRYTKAEVERIWLLFYPWLAIAGAAVFTRSRRWSGAAVVAVQGACAIVLQAALESKW